MPHVCSPRGQKRASGPWHERSMPHPWAFFPTSKGPPPTSICLCLQDAVIRSQHAPSQPSQPALSQPLDKDFNLYLKHECCPWPDHPKNTINRESVFHKSMAEFKQNHDWQAILVRRAPPNVTRVIHIVSLLVFEREFRSEPKGVTSSTLKYWTAGLERWCRGYGRLLLFQRIRVLFPGSTRWV